MTSNETVRGRSKTIVMVMMVRKSNEGKVKSVDVDEDEWSRVQGTSWPSDRRSERKNVQWKTWNKETVYSSEDDKESVDLDC